MSNCCLKCCGAIRHIPTRVICLLLTLLQAGILNYYLAYNLDLYYSFFVICDVIVIALFIAAFVIFYKRIKEKGNAKKEEELEDESTVISFVCWFVYALCLSAKAAISFKTFSYLLNENDFFGPNTFKTTLALSGVIFMLFLTTIHDSKPGTAHRKYVEELSGTVIFDLLDCVDSLEILFIKESRDEFPAGLEDAIIAVACINFLLPTIPLITLWKTSYGGKNLPTKLVLIHKLVLAFVVNLPLLILRMILWHGLNQGISIFSLKNVIVIGIICYDVYEHAEAEEEHEKSDGVAHVVKSNQVGSVEENGYALEDRFNY